MLPKLRVKKKRMGSTCCYICREKGHISSSCPNGNIPKPPLVNDHYSLRKDVVGNLFAKFVGAQSGLEMEKAIWVAKPIVTNFLGPNLVGYHQAQTWSIGVWRTLEIWLVHKEKDIHHLFVRAKSCGLSSYYLSNVPLCGNLYLYCLHWKLLAPCMLRFCI